jgi:hypothetical protein
MPCYHPRRAFRPPPGSVCKKLIFSKIERADLEPVKVPCRQCIGCRLEKSRQWAIRCVHEASLYERNSFITLTYRPEDLPKSRSLDKKAFTTFMRDLRKRICGDAGCRVLYCQIGGKHHKRVFERCSGICPKIRYYMCGEYGAKNGRPHFHACIFNYGFPDRELWSTRDGVRLYVSKMLSEVWGKGFVTIGDVTFESAAYVARYVTKKINGPAAKEHYQRVDEATGEVFDLVPEFTNMSRGSKKNGSGGVGRGWYQKFKSDVYPHDRVVLRGRQLRPPVYYDSLFEVEDPVSMEDIKFRRMVRAKEGSHDCTPARLDMRERHQLLAFKLLRRGYEDEEDVCGP